mgnify:CR=1 FL=1
MAAIQSEEQHRTGANPSLELLHTAHVPPRLGCYARTTGLRACCACCLAAPSLENKEEELSPMHHALEQIPLEPRPTRDPNLLAHTLAAQFDMAQLDAILDSQATSTFAMHGQVEVH